MQCQPLRLTFVSICSPKFSKPPHDGESSVIVSLEAAKQTPSVAAFSGLKPTVLAIAWLVRLMCDNESAFEMMRLVSCLFLYEILICVECLRTLSFE